MLQPCSRKFLVWILARSSAILRLLVVFLNNSNNSSLVYKSGRSPFFPNTFKFSNNIIIVHYRYVGRVSSVGKRLATGWTVWGSNPVGVEGFRTRSNRFWGPPNPLYNGYRVFPRGKASGALRWPPIPSSAEVEGRVELHFYFTSGPSWPLLGWTFTF